MAAPRRLASRTLGGKVGSLAGILIGVTQATRPPRKPARLRLFHGWQDCLLLRRLRRRGSYVGEWLSKANLSAPCNGRSR